VTLLAAAAAALACWLAFGPPAPQRLRDRGDAVEARHSRAWLWPTLVALAVVAVTVAGGLIGGSAGASVAGSAALPLVTAGLVWRRHRARAAASTAAREVFDACQLLAALLRVGHVPAAALRVAAHDVPALAEAAAVQEVGGPVGPALRRGGSAPGRSALVELGIAWEVAERTGASLTATLDALADRLVARRAVGNVVASELAAPRATGRLLAGLPVVGLLLGYSFGGDPLGFLVGSVLGQVSLGIGVALGCAGVLWTERIADSGGG